MRIEQEVDGILARASTGAVRELTAHRAALDAVSSVARQAASTGNNSSN